MRLRKTKQMLTWEEGKKKREKAKKEEERESDKKKVDNIKTGEREKINMSCRKSQS